MRDTPVTRQVATSVLVHSDVDGPVSLVGSGALGPAVGRGLRLGPVLKGTGYRPGCLRTLFL